MDTEQRFTTYIQQAEAMIAEGERLRAHYVREREEWRKKNRPRKIKMNAKEARALFGGDIYG